MKILITGASGYVGSKLYTDLIKTEHDVYGIYHQNKLLESLIQCDLTNLDETKKLITELAPDIIIHTAADAHTDSCEKDPDYAYKINVQATENIVNTIKDKNTKLVLFSTFACYNPSNRYT